MNWYARGLDQPTIASDCTQSEVNDANLRELLLGSHAPLYYEGTTRPDTNSADNWPTFLFLASADGCAVATALWQ